MSNERRSESRRSLERRCWLDQGPDQPPLECSLVNVSKSGAGVKCKEPDRLPDEFNLYLTLDGKIGRKCKVIRRGDGEAGLRFIRWRVPLPRWPAPWGSIQEPPPDNRVPE